MSGQAADYFALFGLPHTASIDGEELAQRYRTLQAQVHPDRHAGAAAIQRQLALTQSSRINDAYATLKKPLSRAAYLLSLYGVNIYDETDTVMPADFLEQQIAWREALMEADDDEARAAIQQQIRQQCEETAAAAVAALEVLIQAGGGETQPAYDLLRRWVYLEKLLAA